MRIISIIDKEFLQNCGDSLLVLEKTNFKNKSGNYLYRCQFKKYPCEVLALKGNIERGNVFNNLVPSVFEKGYLGIGKYNSKDYNDIYKKWQNILNRCYNLKNISYKYYGALNVTVCDEWLNFQNFAAWYEGNSKWNINNYKLEVDKDILFNVNHLKSKVYSPETCLLIPADLNGFLMGDNKKSGVQNRNGRYRVQITYNNLYKSLGTFDSFKKAKEIYAQEKYKVWINELMKFNLPNKLKEIFLKYSFYYE